MPHASFRGVARLHGHALKFHKRSVDGSAKCNFVAAPGGVVIGAIFEVPSDEKQELDRAEGLGDGYEEQEVKVVAEDGEERRMVAYVATSAHMEADFNRTRGIASTSFGVPERTASPRSTSKQ
ncbi:MAG: gamma-glutamylcyclotransferase family protein [Thermoanaerobaculia bacterium]